MPQLPLGLLTAATGHPMLVELKSGETLNGLLVNCDTWMNLTLREVVQTSADGDKFMRLPEIYVRGSTVSKQSSLPELAANVSRSNTSEYQTRSWTWSRSSRSRTKQTEADEAVCTSAATAVIEAAGACVVAGDEDVEEEAAEAGEAREERKWRHPRGEPYS
jgi:U6 snRNA-associated Sm-like protein LSm4